MLYTNITNLYTGSGGFSGLTNGGKIAVTSSVTAFVVGSILFFMFGLLCGHYCWKEKKGMATSKQCEKTPHGTPYYDDLVLNKQQELKLKENVAYVPVRWNVHMQAVIIIVEGLLFGIPLW